MSLFVNCGAFLRRLLFFCLVIQLTLGNARGQDWPAIRGADGYGSQSPGGVLATTKDVGLKVRWKKKIGSGYSSVVLADQRVVTMYTQGESDHIGCFDAGDGAILWQVPIGPKFKGANGSFDGPLSTPVVHDGRVFALSATGRLLCVDLDDGQVLWSRELQEDEKAIQPLYGFVTSPIMAGGTLILQLGAKEKALAGIDPITGKTKWTAGDDAIDSQSPALVNIFGQDIVLSVGGKKLMGVDPSDGKVFFEYEHQGGNAAAVMPVPIGDNEVLLTLDDSFSKAVSLRPGDDASILVSEEWQDRSIKNTYNIPSFHRGHVYAYSTRILTCVDPESGRAIWKDRQPGDGFLITIDGHLIINTKKGSLHLAKASPSGYEEIAGEQIFEDLVWSIPAYSDNAVFMRSLGEIARVDIVATAASSIAASDSTMSTGPQFEKFLNEVRSQSSDDLKAQVVDRFLSSQESFPLIEGDIVHFVYQGDRSDVALAGDMFGARQEKKMTRVDGTNLFYLSMKLPTDQRANYVFFADYKPQRDTLNPRTATSSVYAGEMEFAVRLATEKPLEMSWFAMSDWKPPKFLESLPEKLFGEVVQRTMASKLLETDLDVEVYLPPNYSDDSDQRFPVVYVFGGAAARKLGRFAEIADNIFQNTNGRAGEPNGAILVFLDAPAGPAGPGPNYFKAITDEVVPYIDNEFMTVADRGSRSCVGFGFTAAMALTAVGASPEIFGGVSVQSPLIFDAAQAMVLNQFQKIERPTRVHLEWGRFDLFNPHENWDIRTSTKEVYEALENNPHLTVTGGMVNDSTDWSSWRNRFDQVLSITSPSQ